MSKPVVQLVGPNSAAEIALAWDMPSTYWDSGLYWDSNTFQAEKLVPIVNVAQGGIEIGVV